jgi:hypothetical protein
MLLFREVCMKLNEKHPAMLLTLWGDLRVSAKEISTGDTFEFTFFQIDWDTEGIEKDGIVIGSIPCEDHPFRRDIIVSYESMVVLENKKSEPREDNTLLDNDPWIINYLSTLRKI